jgi:hypothetical protein
MRKYTLDIFKELPKTKKSQNLNFFLTGPRDPRYGLPIRNPVIDGISSIARPNFPTLKKSRKTVSLLCLPLPKNRRWSESFFNYQKFLHIKSVIYPDKNFRIIEPALAQN